MSIFDNLSPLPLPPEQYTLETSGKAASLTINKWGNSKFAAKIIKLTGKQLKVKKTGSGIWAVKTVNEHKT